MQVPKDAPQWITLKKWIKGIINRSESPFDAPMDALTDGLNLTLVEGGLKTRPGSSVMSTGSLPAYPVLAQFQARFPTNEVTYLLVQCNNKLYACVTQLPSGTGTFQEIWDFGATTAGTCTFAQMNDRCIITEGVASVPLVFPGALASTATAADWPHGKNVLITQDRERFYDVSPQLCDKDPTTVALVGNIQSYGGIYFCSDMPKLTGLYIDMGTVNTGTGATVNTYTAPPVTFTDSTLINRQDARRGLAVNWNGTTAQFFSRFYCNLAAVVNVGGGKVGFPCTNNPYLPGQSITMGGTTNYNATFTVDPTSTSSLIVVTHAYVAETLAATNNIYSVANTAQTLGAGNSCPDVVPGVIVEFANNITTKIASITANTIAGFTDYPTSYPPTSQVSAIYGIDISAGGAVLMNDYGLATPQVGTTTGLNQLQVITWDSISSLVISQTTPGTSTIYHAVSFDNQATFKVWTAAAWRQIIRLNGTAWEYNTSATSTPSWSAATINSRIGALKQAFGVAQNQMTAATLSGLTSGNWASAGGFVATTTATIDFAFQFVPDATTLANVPLLTSYTMSYVKAAQSIVEVFQNGAWVGTGWTDNTISGGNRLAQSGAISGSVKTADYTVINSVPGYYYRILTNGLSASTAISRIRCQAPTQALSNIGSGQPDLLNGFLYQNHATGSLQDGTVNLSNNNLTAIQSVALPMVVGDYWYAGCYAQFDQLMLQPFADKSDPTYTNNQLVAATILEYWTGSAWATLTFSDGTAVNGCTLATAGLMSWTIPSDWKQSIPFNTFFSQAYWIRGKVTAALSPLTAISAVRAFTVPTPLVKYKYVATYGPRLALGNKPDAPDQVDISRPFEEYGFTGDAPSFRIGGQDQIVFLKAAWMGLLVGKLHTFHFADPASLAPGSTTAPFSTVEASGNTPMNAQAIAKGPMSGFDYGDKYGLFFMNQNGFYVTTGLHVDNVFATSRGKTLSDALSWWDPPPGQYPRLDLDNLHRACSEYWPNKGWIVTAAPFLLTPTSGPQTTNNRLMVYDLSLQAWLPLFSFPWDIASLTTAYHYNANAPGKLGSLGMYAGDYAGNVYRLFDTAETTDNGTAISGHATFGYVNYGQMDGEKQIRNVQLFGFTDGDAVQLTITGLKFSRQATATNTTVMRSTALAGLSTPGGIAFLDTGQGANNLGNVHQYRFDFTAYTELYALQVAVEGLRERPAT